MNAITPLPERFPGLWPDHAPTSLLDLTETPACDLRDLASSHGWTEDEQRRVFDTRRDAIVASHAGSKESLNSPATLRRMFDQGVLRAVASKWTSYALDRNRLRVLTPTRSGELRYVYRLTDIVPDVEWLSAKAPLPDDGAWLLIFGGSPTWVKPAQQQRLSALIASGLVVDVVYRHLRKGEPPVTYSTRAHCGAVGTSRVEWPATRG